MSYAAMLENYLEEEKYANDTFAGISSCLESLTSFVNEDVNFEMTISLTEAESGDIKEKDKKVSAAIKNGISKLISKLEAFIEKIGEAVKRFIAKAKVTIAQKGNETLKKMLSNNGYVIGKDVKVRAVKVNGVKGAKVAEGIYKAVTDANNAISKEIISIQNAMSDGKAVSVNRNKEVIDTLSTSLEKSDATTLELISAVKKWSVKDAYQEYVGQYLDVVSNNISKIDGQAKESQKYCKEIIKTLKKAENGSEINAESIAAVNGISSDLMRLATGALNYSMSLLTLATKNGAKIALAAVDATGKAAAVATKNAANTAKDKAGEIKDNAKAKAQEVAGKFGKGKKEEAPAEA